MTSGVTRLLSVGVAEAVVKNGRAPVWIAVHPQYGAEWDGNPLHYDETISMYACKQGKSDPYWASSRVIAQSLDFVHTPMTFASADEAKELSPVAMAVPLEQAPSFIRAALDAA